MPMSFIVSKNVEHSSEKTPASKTNETANKPCPQTTKSSSPLINPKNISIQAQNRSNRGHAQNVPVLLNNNNNNNNNNNDNNNNNNNNNSDSDKDNDYDYY